MLEDTSACHASGSGIHPITFLSLERPHHTSPLHQIQHKKAKTLFCQYTKIMIQNTWTRSVDAASRIRNLERQQQITISQHSSFVNLDHDEQFNKVIPFVCVSHAYSRASLAPTIQIFYRCLRGCSMLSEKKKKKKVFLIQAKRPCLSSPCLMLWAYVGFWRAHFGKCTL